MLKTKGWPFRLAVLLVVGMVILALAGGCAKQQEQKPSAAQGGATSEQPKAEDDLAFYNGKIVTWIVSTKAGGGYDSYARMLAPYLQKYLPGSTVIVKNVEGAGHIIGVNELYAAKPDGLTLGTFNAGLIIQQLAGNEAIRFDLSKLTYLGNAVSTHRVFVVSSKSPYKTFDDILKNSNRVRLASAGVGSSSHVDALLVNKIFNINMKIVPGYSGQEGDLAMMRGEVDGQIGMADQMDQLIERGEARAVLVFGGKNVDLSKYPGAKVLSEIAPASSQPLVNLMNAMAALSRPIAAPPGLPEGKTKVLRDALWKAMNDPELQEKANQAKLPVQPVSGEETAKMFKDALNQPPEVVELVKELVRAQAEGSK